MSCRKPTERETVEGQEGFINSPRSAPLPLCLQLFDHVSESLKDFMEEENISQEEKQPLAFTFSFPCEHLALDKVLSPYIQPPVHPTLYIS